MLVLSRHRDESIIIGDNIEPQSFGHRHFQQRHEETSIRNIVRSFNATAFDGFAHAALYLPLRFQVKMRRG